MAALVVFGVKIPDAEAFKPYQAAGGKSLAGRNFKVLAGPAPNAILEGDNLEEVMILEFPTLAEARDWYDSPEYQHAISLRQPVSETFSFIVETRG
jgi:uncharacterized protein (DUF1330 family)